MQALGMIETRGTLAAIEAVDVMLKAADVTLVEKTKIGGGLVTSDGFVVKHFPDAAAYHYPAAVVGAILVVLLGWIFARRAKERAKGRPAHQVGGGTTS